MDTAGNVALHPTGELAALRAEIVQLQAQLAEMRERDAHLRIAMQASKVVAYRWDIVRDRVTRLRGSSEPGDGLEDAGTFEDVVAKVWPDDQATFRADIAAALASLEGFYRTELRYRRPTDGAIRWLSETGRVLRDDAGQPVRMVGITFDITDRKQAEDALREAEAQLREQAERKDEFLAILAHELRNPLAPIRNAVHILRLVMPPDRSGDMARDIIERQVGQLVRLVDDLLDVSRVARGKITLQQATVDLRDVARHALDTSQSLLGARGHAVQLTLPSEAVPVRGDEARLTQVFTNLLNNAAKYTDAGGRVELVVAPDADAAVVAVRDNGRGLDAAELERVFDMFFQAERDRDLSQGGLGLGLSLVKRLVELHGGSVHAASAGRGQGCTFSVRLPLVRTEPAGAATADAAAQPQRHALRVLVVDDLHDAADSLAALLRLQGHEVHVAHDGHAAVATALRERPALVLLDIGLPGLNGYDACRAMREAGLTDALIVAVSGHGQPEDRRLSQVSGFDDHLVKPVELGQLQALVERRAGAGGD
jgi:signal transduction histidine kinase/ActR/RegA family two-component response regulator